ncbi:MULTISPECIES: ABC transporter substrate-binding protein [unclassified Curtobacterium]|uniref:ABC transporter substrate-binding protein n=1 Tax=unclassified Curtobacterium TaxID=257496 RepID=UPI000825B2DB|nr:MULTISPECIES: ABC transporter substrate-binding protein [unclassified Curtobacterium]WIA98140.1 ABC transporter substrate-binding protein [Curtobacterium sp. MCBA15_004]WIB01394.1 ABC transporter substrate-binding protein [Curtobacterium sp. MCBA15_012]
MITAPTKRLAAAVAVASAVALTLAGCSSSDPLSSGSGSGDSKTIVVGSQAYPSNEIIAELYAQELEHEGFTVTKKLNIGQRKAYWPEIEKGSISVFPEYNGNLLNFLLQEDGKSTTTETTTDGINSALSSALPSGVKALPSADASDADTYTVTQETADKYGLKSIADLSKIGGTISIAANPEFATAAYGPKGLKEKYGIDGTVNQQNDSGGPLTIKAIQDGDAQVADIYSASASIKTEKLVTLEDPKHLVPANNVTPIVSKDLDSKAADAIEKVNKLLTTDVLIELNRQNSVDQKSASSVAKAFLQDKGLL